MANRRASSSNDNLAQTEKNVKQNIVDDKYSFGDEDEQYLQAVHTKTATVKGTRATIAVSKTVAELKKHRLRDAFGEDEWT